MTMTKKSSSTQKKAKRRVSPWHDRFGTLFKLFNMRAVIVSTGFDIAKEMPRGDVLLLLNEKEEWTEEQCQYLPDGVRDDSSKHKLLEFKYTESFNEDALEQTLGYNIFYRRSHGLERSEVDSYLVVSSTPNAETLQYYNYQEAEHPGVYRTDRDFIKEIAVVALNDLRDEPHNAYVKLFASRKGVKRRAISQLKKMGVFAAFTELSEFVYAMAQVLFKEERMDLREDEHLDAEVLIEIGREMAKAYFNHMMAQEEIPDWGEQFLASLPPERRMAGLPPEQRMAGLPSELRTAGLEVEELQDLIKQAERLIQVQRTEQLDHSSAFENAD